MLQQEALDLRLDGVRLADQLLAEPQDLAVGLLLLGGDPDRVEQALGRELGQPAAVQAIALGLRADRGQQLRRRDDLCLVALGPQATCQAEAGRHCLIDDLRHSPPCRLQPLDEELRPCRLGPGGQEPTLDAVEGHAVRSLVDVDADMDHLALLEAQRGIRLADDLELASLGVRHGQYLRSKTRVSNTQVYAPNGSSAFMLSIGTRQRATVSPWSVEMIRPGRVAPAIFDSPHAREANGQN